MQIIKNLITLTTVTVASPIVAQLPVEVISSCIHDKAMRPSVTITELTTPRFIETEESGCEDHFENAIDNLTYGGILCDNYGYIILNKQRIKLSAAANFSINPTIKPGEVGDHMDLHSYWLKIDFAGNSYLCVKRALSDSGVGASVNHYYIVENPYSPNSTLHYYFFKEDIMPIESLTD